MAPCPNCQAELQPEARYCSGCGQQVIQREDLRSLFDHFLADYFTFDSKIARSIVPLLVRPGELTLEYQKGRRARYIPPLRMFIFLSILFFLVIGWTGGRSVEKVDDIEDALFWDNFFSSILPKLFFLFLPLFALLVRLFFRGKASGDIGPFIFSAHFHAFVFLNFTIYALLSRTFSGFGLVQVNQVIIGLFIAYTAYYLWAALRKVYPGRLWPHLLKFISLIGLYTILLIAAALFTAWMLMG